MLLIVEVLHFTNFDLDNINTLLDVSKLEQVLTDSQYSEDETDFLVDGFRNGFDIGNQGPVERQSRSENIPFTVGNKEILWNKIMTEVKDGRMAGPFRDIPFNNYIQSPVGLVPKSGNRTRMIFHLSFNFGSESQEDEQSLNACTPKEICSVRYNDLDDAVQNCIVVSKFALDENGQETVFLGKTDLSMAFRVLPMKKGCYCWLVLKAVDPSDNTVKYFVDKCLPFGASISCAHYQCFSNALKLVLEWRIGCQGRRITNYLDDFLFIAITWLICNFMIDKFLELCHELNLPVAVEKPKWGSTVIVFLGILLNGAHLTLGIPLEKQVKALNLLNDLTGKRKVTIKQLQVLTGYLNFLTKAIFPGQPFIRRLYAKYANLKDAMTKKGVLKCHHHVKIDNEFRFNCEIWHTFLTNFRNNAVCRPMVDVNKVFSAKQLNFYSDASGKIGFGAVFNNLWTYGRWDSDFLKKDEPSSKT